MSARVLLIDDSPDIHDLVEAALAGHDLTVLHADSAASCCTRVKETRPDLILLDVNMPGIDGFEACQQLQADSATQRVPIIFLTGQNDPEHKVTGLELGAVDYVSKPFHKAELLARVRTVLRIKRQSDKLAEQAQTDVLTGLRNRTALQERLVEALAAAQRYGRISSLVMIDLDHFKAVNDTYGHLFGDSVLQALARVLDQTARKTDVACRYGGEEFAVLLSDANLEQGLRAAERMRVAIAALVLTAGNTPVRVTASLGVASTAQWLQPDVLSPSQLIAAADAALYQAKRAGRNQVAAAAVNGACLLSEMGQQASALPAVT
jgi:diguanylate cyclase (GGDEF)-like protein